MKDSKVSKIISKRFKKYLETVINGDYEELNRFSSMPNYYALRKTMVHFGVLAVSFEGLDIFKFNHSEWGDK